MNTDKLWKQYSRNKNVENRNILVLEYLDLVNKIVNIQMRLYHTFNPDLKEEFYSIGVIGLIDAIQKFDYSKNVKFETYASFRVKGAIIDYIRKQDIVSRGLREKEKAINNARENLINRNQREPSEIEIAEELNISIEEFSKTINHIAQADLLSFEEMVSNGIGIKQSDYDVEKKLEEKELQEYLAKAISNLPEREQYVISMYYKDELKLKDIGRILDLSESRVSQLLKKAVSNLRDYLKRQFAA
ncbi:MAG: sigma-70 family RNA polymerase sigma factor [Clostridia bacterium]